MSSIRHYARLVILLAITCLIIGVCAVCFSRLVNRPVPLFYRPYPDFIGPPIPNSPLSDGTGTWVFLDRERNMMVIIVTYDPLLVPSPFRSSTERAIFPTSPELVVKRTENTGVIWE